MSLADKIRKSREQKVTVGKWAFRFHRPTDHQMILYRSNSAVGYDVIIDLVFGWEGMTEADLFPGGSLDLAPFDTAAFTEWLGDHPDIWPPIYDDILRAYREHVAKRTDAGNV